MNRRLTKEEFIEKAKLIHKNKYIYSDVKYINMSIKVEIICIKHGKFMQCPRNHLQGFGCAKCSKRYRYTTEEFIEKAEDIHHGQYDYSKLKYHNAKEKVTIICKNHGKFFQYPCNHLCGQGCPKCNKSFKLTTNRIVKRFKNIHGKQYNYSKVNYINKRKKVIIICRKHGEFRQYPNIHLRGFGCSKCSKTYKYTTKEFIEVARKIHGNRYDYSKVQYVNSKKKITIICKEHGEFEQICNNHLGNHGCPKCAKMYSPNTAEFVEKSVSIHGDKYDYSKVEYTNNRKKVIIICKKHGEFKQSPNIHLSGSGCKECGKETFIKKKTYGFDRFLKCAKKVHGNKYDYSNVKYKNLHTKILIICKKHGEFKQSPRNHITGHGCSICGNNVNSNTKEFIDKSRKVHGDKYDYSKVEYINNRKKVVIICEKHGEFKQSPHEHLCGKGCIRCKGRISKMGNKWLDSLNIPEDYREKHIILHTGRKIIVDALDEENKIIYEYDHPFWHGHPDMDLDSVHPIIGKKYKELYLKTIKRRKEIIKSGYSIIWTYGDGHWVCGV